MDEFDEVDTWEQLRVAPPVEDPGTGDDDADRCEQCWRVTDHAAWCDR